MQNIENWIESLDESMKELAEEHPIGKTLNYKNTKYYVLGYSKDENSILKIIVTPIEIYSYETQIMAVNLREFLDPILFRH